MGEEYPAFFFSFFFGQVVQACIDVYHTSEPVPSNTSPHSSAHCSPFSGAAFNPEAIKMLAEEVVAHPHTPNQRPNHAQICPLPASKSPLLQVPPPTPRRSRPWRTRLWRTCGHWWGPTRCWPPTRRRAARCARSAGSASARRRCRWDFPGAAVAVRAVWSASACVWGGGGGVGAIVVNVCAVRAGERCVPRCALA